MPPYCPLTDADHEALRAFSDEVIDRLYALNAERAREEERLGLGKAAKGKGKAAPKAKGPKATKGKKAPEGQGGLF